ncbi:P-loop containing nucleoside triphosphate hydrolase [Listeria phage LP-KV022]|uniref:P-loop containing nucleoside triphosphate hydrolase n=7 Tax=Homburgvirus TaxID=1921125 RepID=A0A5A4K5S5_9CAUD|nr:hypothetical protein P70_0045 [Listeria phage P70]YP_008240464.1 P-loop containing nucleoside triphosphate hydrolase [Listeria phage LP-110]YP_009045077.1 P-loop containing nucleoside triphosphate hydrolase [Listeria phage LP-114]AWY07682.1 P-loop containing nucleoside triphosphate hydrolase [Listeria phage LP-KV022]QDK04548.1 hypothetical protein FK481_0034 [Listeria phage LP-010]QDK04656.1 hypothetical protein FK482_0034 [Listeria phage LP-013]QDK04767.1 hypothetical protein FK484_0034 [
MKYPSIAIIGKSRTGKSTIAEFIASYTGNHHMGFGKAMKDEFHRTFPDIPRSPKPRDEYIKYGQAMREIDEDVWVKKLSAQMPVGSVGVVIDDVRQENELDFCIRGGMLIIQVVCDDDVALKRAEHLGEDLEINNELDVVFDGKDIPIDAVITNNGRSYTEVYDQILDLLESWKKDEFPRNT